MCIKLIKIKYESGGLQMKLINTVVDLKMRLVGFIAEGKEREFGGFTNEIITKPVVLKALSDSNFKNNHLQAIMKVN